MNKGNILNTMLSSFLCHYDVTYGFVIHMFILVINLLKLTVPLTSQVFFTWLNHTAGIYKQYKHCILDLHKSLLGQMHQVTLLCSSTMIIISSHKYTMPVIHQGLHTFCFPRLSHSPYYLEFQHHSTCLEVTKISNTLSPTTFLNECAAFSLSTESSSNLSLYYIIHCFRVHSFILFYVYR